MGVMTTMEKLLSRKVRWTFIGVMLLVFIMSSIINAETEIPEDYGAKGAIQDDEITLEKALTYAIQDEYLAQARYDAVIEKFGPTFPFTNIKVAEQRHIDALVRLHKKYDVEITENFAKQYTPTPTTLKQAFEASVDGEKDNIAMYEKLAEADVPKDVKRVFTNLKKASKNHLASFESGLDSETESE